MAKKYPLLAPDVAARNGVGKDVLLVAEAHEALYSEIATNFYSKKQGDPHFKLNPRVSQGLTGRVTKNEAHLPHGSLAFPLTSGLMPSLDDDRSIR
jgi:5'-3' exoribonuclease 2